MVDFRRALAGMLLTPVMLIGSLLVLGQVFFSWLEERSLARTLGRRTAREPKAMRWLRKKLGIELGRPPRVPWLFAAVFVALPFALLLSVVPAIAVILLVAITHSVQYSPVFATLIFGVTARHRRIVLGATERNFGTLGNVLTVWLFVYVAAALDWHNVYDGAAVAAAFDDAADRNLGMVLGRERHEHRVVAKLVWGLVEVVLVAYDSGLFADHLRGSCLAANGDVGERGLVRGAARTVDNIAHRVAHELFVERFPACRPWNRHHEVAPRVADPVLDLALVVALGRAAELLGEQVVTL